MRVPRRGKTKGPGSGVRGRRPGLRKRNEKEVVPTVKGSEREEGGDGRTDFVAEKIPSLSKKSNKERKNLKRTFLLLLLLLLLGGGRAPQAS